MQLFSILVGQLQQFSWGKKSVGLRFRDISFLSIQVGSAKLWGQNYHYNLEVQTLPVVLTQR